MRHVISVLLENEAGALSRVVGLFSSRGYNIESLIVAPTEDPTLSRMTITSSGSDEVLEQITGALNGRAADTDHQVRVGLLQLAPTAELGEHLVLRLLTDRAGVEQDHVGFFGFFRDLQGLMLAQQVDHARAVVLVHLAAVGFDIQLLGHAGSKGGAQNRAL